MGTVLLRCCCGSGNPPAPDGPPPAAPAPRQLHSPRHRRRLRRSASAGSSAMMSCRDWGTDAGGRRLRSAGGSAWSLSRGATPVVGARGAFPGTPSLASCASYGSVAGARAAASAADFAAAAAARRRHAEAVAAVRDLLSDPAAAGDVGAAAALLREERALRDWMTDHRVACYLPPPEAGDAAGGGEADAAVARRAAVAAARIAEMVLWRHAARPAAPCPLCLDDPTSHSFRQVSVDSAGRCLVYSCLAHALGRGNVAMNIAHVLWAFEQESEWERATGAAGLVIVVDMFGFSTWVDANPASAIGVARRLSYYRGVLQCAYMIDAPAVFSSSYNVVKGWLPEGAAELIQFVSRREAMDELRRSCSAETAAWLVREMDDNRARRCGTARGEKAYWRAPAAGEHDGRGAPELLAHPRWMGHPYPRREARPPSASL